MSKRKSSLNKKANDYYDKYLLQIEKIMGNGTTHDKQLTRLGKKIFGKDFKGTFACDKIPNLNHGQMCIANLDNSYEPGSHWVGIVRDKNNLIVYDSFGRRTLKILPGFHNKNKEIIRESENDPEQKKVEENCGQRCLSALLVYRVLGKKALMHI